MDAKLTADRYIERGGYTNGERSEKAADDLLCVALFIGWHDDAHIQGGRRADEAFISLCRLLNLDAVNLRKIVRGEH